MAATSHDVARLAGVSQPTVSRALRGMPGIAPRTLERIQRAAEELAYVPSEAGRSLSTQRTRCIGIVASDLKNPFYPELVEPMRVDLERLGYRVLLIPDSSETPLQLSRLIDGTLDGVIVTTALLDSKLPHELSVRKIPFVLVNRDIDSVDTDKCVIDNSGGAAQIAELLINMGHRSIGALFGPSDTSTGRGRERGFREVLARHGLPFPDELSRHGPFSFDVGARLAGELLDAHARPTALFCANDVLALGAIDAVIARGLVVGKDVSVVGFDDIEMAHWNAFSLTTVKADLDAMAAHAVRMLTRRIEDTSLPFEHVTLPAATVLRTSHLHDSFEQD